MIDLKNEEKSKLLKERLNPLYVFTVIKNIPKAIKTKIKK